MGAMIFDNEAARAFGLIDGTASRGETVVKLAELAGVSKSYQVVRPGEEDAGVLRRLLAAMAPPQVRQSAPTPAEVLEAEWCSAVRAPLAYYGDPGQLCR
jgi:hypothetical protein